MSRTVTHKVTAKLFAQAKRARRINGYFQASMIPVEGFAYCGMNPTDITKNWALVTCKRCLKKKDGTSA